MRNFKQQLKYCLLVLLASFNSMAHAADSYRFFHVTIDTPWLIFIFLLAIILFPFVLSAILYWHFTLKKHREKKAVSGADAPSNDEYFDKNIDKEYKIENGQPEISPAPEEK